MPAINCGFAGETQGVKLLAYYGAAIGVTIGLDKTWEPTLQRAPRHPGGKHEALIDTGADESLIDSAILSKLNLQSNERKQVCGVGTSEVDLYTAQIHIIQLKYTIWGRFAACPLRERGFRHDVLLGRTFLREFRFRYDGRSADVAIEFMPSVVES